MDSHRRPVLFVSMPESGLLNPLLVLAQELSRRGVDDLWFATDENRRTDITALKVGTPVEFASLGPVVPELSAVTWDDDTYRRVTQRSRARAHRAVIRQAVRPRLRAAKYRRLAEVVDEVRPALMVVESMCQFGYELAITRGIPFVLSVPFLPSTVLSGHTPFGRTYTPRTFPVPHTGLPRRMSIRQQLTNQLFKWGTLAMFATPDMAARVAEEYQVRQELGLARATRSLMAKIDAAEMALCYSVPELDYSFAIPEKVHLVGAMVPPLPQIPYATAVGRWLATRDSVVYVAFGTVARLTREEVRALVEVARRMAGSHDVLWKLPAEQQRLLPEATALPGNLRIESWIPSQLDVLAHPAVKVVVHHGGGNVFHESLYFGKPSVVRPMWVDCYDQAVRGQEFGFGLTVDDPQTVDPNDLFTKLNTVLRDDRFRQRAEYFGQLQRAAGGRGTAASLLLRTPTLATTA